MNYKKQNRKKHYFTDIRRKISCYKFILLELLAVRITFFKNLLYRWRRSVFLKEIKMVDISSTSQVLHIGCGILPNITMMISKETGADVVGIDNSKQAVKYARRFVLQQGLSDKITIKYGDGANFPVEDFNVVFIAINVWPLTPVLKNLEKNLRNNSNIICKNIEDNIEYILESEKLSDSFKIVSKLKNPKSYTYLLVKKS